MAGSTGKCSVCKDDLFTRPGNDDSGKTYFMRVHRSRAAKSACDILKHKRRPLTASEMLYYDPVSGMFKRRPQVLYGKVGI